MGDLSKNDKKNTRQYMFNFIKKWKQCDMKLNTMNQ